MPCVCVLLFVFDYYVVPHTHGSLAYKIMRACKYLWFSVFPNFRKVGKFAAFVERPKAKKVFRLPGASPFPPLTRALGPAGGYAPDPRYRLAFRDRHGVPPTLSSIFCGPRRCYKKL